MKKGQIVDGYVEKVEFPNKGIVRVEEEKTDGTAVQHRALVKGVLPGQTVRISMKKVRKEKCQGILREVIKPSDLETRSPRCPYFGDCGGCTYQTIPYEKQLELKKDQVFNLLLPVCGTESDNDLNQKADVSGKPSSILNQEAFKKQPVFDGVLSSPSEWAYRNKMEFSFGDEVKDGPLTLGLHKKGSFHDILHVSGCQIIHQDYSMILDCVRDYCAEQALPFYQKRTHEGLLRHLLVRRCETTGEMLVALVTSSQYQKEEMEVHLQALSARLQELKMNGTLAGFLHMINDGLGDVVKSDTTRILYGKDWFTEEILGLKYRITPFSFFQTNTKGAEVLYSCVRDYMISGSLVSEQTQNRLYGTDLNNPAQKGQKPADAPEEGNRSTGVASSDFRGAVSSDSRGAVSSDSWGAVSSDFRGAVSSDSRGAAASDSGEAAADSAGFHGKTAFDLYSGTGTIAQILAPVMDRVIGVEIVEEAVEAARENAQANGLENCEFIAGDVLKVLDEISEKPEYIILDPPRDGLHPKALKKIAEYQVDKIIYISCKPTSLARDLSLLQEYGYRAERFCCVDMFPETVHVETVVGLQRIGT